MADKQDLDINALRENILQDDPNRGDLAFGTAVSELVKDSLTGLDARGMWFAKTQQFVEHARREHESFLIAMVDVDNFKEYNDKFGHPAGDEFLAKVGEGIRKSLREEDIKGRYGGDEFIILMPLVKADRYTGEQLEEKEKSLTEKISSFVSDELHVDNRIIVSVGIAKWDGVQELDEVIKNADSRLYLVKNAK